MVTIYVFRMTGMTRNMTEAQASFLGKGIVIVGRPTELSSSVGRPTESSSSVGWPTKFM